jgi:hypothetical protein
MQSFPKSAAREASIRFSKVEPLQDYDLRPECYAAVLGEVFLNI